MKAKLVREFLCQFWRKSFFWDNVWNFFRTWVIFWLKLRKYTRRIFHSPQLSLNWRKFMNEIAFALSRMCITCESWRSWECSRRFKVVLRAINLCAMMEYFTTSSSALHLLLLWFFPSFSQLLEKKKKITEKFLLRRNILIFPLCETDTVVSNSNHSVQQFHFQGKRNFYSKEFNEVDESFFTLPHVIMNKELKFSISMNWISEVNNKTMIVLKCQRSRNYEWSFITL